MKKKKKCGLIKYKERPVAKSSIVNKFHCYFIGMFSYYLMKELEGKADNNKDKKIINGELIANLKQNVTEEAFINNRQQ